MKIEDRIEELERRVRELEARPIAYPPVYVPYPVYPAPYNPNPFFQPCQPFTITGVAGAAAQPSVWINPNLGGCAAAAGSTLYITGSAH